MDLTFSYKVTNKDVKRLPVNRLPVLEPVTGFKNI